MFLNLLGTAQGALIRAATSTQTLGHFLVMRQTNLFSSSYTNKANAVFLRPGNQYSWDEIIRGAPVRTQAGTIRFIPAVGTDTFRGFHRVNKLLPGAKGVFTDYFIQEKPKLLSLLLSIGSRDSLHTLQNNICAAVKSRLHNINPRMLVSYNKTRKPVDLYIEHLVAMARELESRRARLTPFLFLPIDSQIMRHRELLDDCDLAAHSLSRRSTYKDVTTEQSYLALQDILEKRAASIANSQRRPFHPIYFDLVWNKRYDIGGQTYSRRILPKRVAQQIVGRERRERVSQLTWCGSGCLDSRRRVNSNVRRPAFSRCGREWLGVGGCVAGWIEARQATRWIFPDVQARMMATI